MKLILYVIVLIFSLAANAAPAGFRHINESEQSVSKLIRSNAFHYWNAVRDSAFQAPLAEFIQHQGVVAGDPHFGNFSIVPLVDLNGSERLKFANVDFDDAGVGPFALDFLRLIISSKAIEWDLKMEDGFGSIREMLNSYVIGLNGGSVAVPSAIESEIAKGLGRYNEKLDEYVAKRLAGADKNKLELVDGEVVLLGRRLENLRSELPSHFQGMDVLDAVRVLKDRGGSAGVIRLHVLVRDQSGRKRIFELKQWQETGLSAYQPQKNLRQWVEDLYPVFWPGQSKESYLLVRIDGQFFWKREKKKTLIDVPYKIEEPEDLVYLQQLAPYVANQLGQIHGRQESASPYKQLLNNTQKQESFRLAIKNLYKLYLQSAVDAMP